ncbi:MAG: cation-translocating P-type ATPase [Candidatus Methylomirabilales bacterium]
MTQPEVSSLEQSKVPAWHALEMKAVVEMLKTDPHSGLSKAQAASRLGQYGFNTLKTVGHVPWYVVFARQFLSGLILILVAAAAIALAIGEVTDAITILAIVVLNGILGFVQEWKAERAIEALQRMLSPHCTVVRDGLEQDIDATTLVPGDVVLLKIGDRVPADLRLVEALNLRADESSLTGESVPVGKGIEPVDPTALLSECSSIAWMGTAITNGLARGLAVETGMTTEFGRIAQLTQAVGEETTPLQRKLGVLGRQLGILAIGISMVVGTTGWLLGKPLLEMFLTGVALAVAVVPEGLPAVVTITLALGIRAMVRRRALLRRLQAAETLGAATVICTDKTGTLTQNEMTVQRVWLPSGEIGVSGVGYDPSGQFTIDGQMIEPEKRRDLLALLETGLRCNHARLYHDADGWQKIGEPTEAALIVTACKAGLDPAEAAHSVTEFSFNSIRKRMTIVEHRPEGLVAQVKGAPEVIVERCRHILDGEQERELTETDRVLADAAYQSLAEQGLRTLALAHRSLPPGIALNAEQVERDLTLLGIVGIIDPPRSEVPDAIRLAYSAGIQVIMITGDASATALSIARRIGLRAERAISGRELDTMDDAALRAALVEDALFARTTPEHKLRIVSLLQEMGQVAGMTGDGVNDAPALKKADIGIAMGLRGTDVAKGASDMILTDDNFASIIGAVEEGRRQYDNIQKFVRYLLSSNTGEVIAIFVNILLGGPLILLPVQILWMNLVTDGMTAVALGVEPVEEGIMYRPPHPPREPILDRLGIIMILLLGGYMGVGTLWLFHHYLASGQENAVALAQTVAFTGIILLEKMNVFNFRSLREPLAVIGFFSNPWLLLAWTTTVGLQVCVVYVPFLQEAMHTVPLGWSDWGLMLVVAAPVFLMTETVKWVRRRSPNLAREKSADPSTKRFP